MVRFQLTDKWQSVNKSRVTDDDISEGLAHNSHTQLKINTDVGYLQNFDIRLYDIVRSAFVTVGFNIRNQFCSI